MKEAVARDGTPTPNAPRRPSTLRVALEEGVRFWEPRRLIYIGAQLVVTAVFLAVRHKDAHLFVLQIWGYAFFAIVSNFLYTLAYLAEPVLDIPAIQPHARRIRWGLFLAGTCLSCFLAAVAMDWVILNPAIND